MTFASVAQASGMKQIALVTGVGRALGLGAEVGRQLAVRGYVVVLSARRSEQACAVARELAHPHITSVELDVASDESVLAARSWIEQRFGRLDALVNNASASFDVATPTLNVPLADARAGFEVDLFGAWRTMRAFARLLRQSGRARIVNVSSGAGAFGVKGGLTSPAEAYASTFVTYAVAKAALNALTIKFAAAFRDTGVLVNAVSPGFVATHPGLAELGARPVAEGARGVVWAATLPPGGPTGGFFEDGQPHPW